MDKKLHPAAIEHLPTFVTAPGETDVLMVVSVFILLGAVVAFGVLLALSAGAPLENAAQFANAAAGVVVGKIGTATVSPQELLKYVNHR